MQCAGCTDAGEGSKRSDTPLRRQHMYISYFVDVLILCNAQGSVDRGRRVQSKRSDGSFMEQLEVMHQPLDSWEAGGHRSRPAQQEACAEAGASVMQMCASMARKPHWQKGKLGAPAQPPALCLAPVLLSVNFAVNITLKPQGTGYQ